MESGDGLLLRVRPRAARLSGSTLCAIAEISRNCGNGTVDLTRRANLQIRGVRPETLEPALSTLAKAGLLDGDARDEAVRNILVCPLAGSDPSAPFDAAAVAEALEDELVRDPALRDLPPKFSFLIDEGGRLALDDVAADIRIEAEGRLARLAIGGDGRTAARVALVPACEAVGAALALARAFLRLDPRPRSMRSFPDAREAIALARSAGLPKPPPTIAASRLPSSREPIFGPQPDFFGVGAAFGSFTAEQLSAIGDEAADGVRLTPWRAILLPGLGARAGARFAPLGLVVGDGDPRLSIAACPGRPACLSGEIATRAFAETLAASLREHPAGGITLHVSGCAKGCAHSTAVPATLVGREGRFDLVLDGTARDAPALSGLNAAQAERALSLASSRALAS